MSYLLALDQGTTSSRAIIFDEDSRLVASAQMEFTQYFPQPGWVEHDAAEIWSSQLAVTRAVLAKANLRASDIAAIGITNQRETTVVWDRKTGEPIHRAIVWQDRRTANICENLKLAGYSDLVRSQSGLVIDSYFSGTKIAFILDAVPGARLKAEKGELAFGTIDSWLIWNLTGGTSAQGAIHVTDVSNASRTMLFDIRRGVWSSELCAALNVPMAGLPRVVMSSECVGETSVLGSPVVIAAIAGDQQSALFGQACLSAGMAKNTYGTGCFMLSHTGSVCVPAPKGLLLTSACQVEVGNPQYAVEGSVFVGGAVVQWLRDGLGVIKNSVDVEALAASVPSSDGVVFVPAFTGLGAPYWDPHARGAIQGLSRGSTVAHIARAALEAIAFQSTELLQAMHGSVQSLRVDGGASANNLLMQMQADLSGVQVVRPKILETTALGAAYLAGLALGIWKNTDEISAQWQYDRVFQPSISVDERESRMMAWRSAVSRVETQKGENTLG
jgi:glycerol kinase